MANRVRSNSSCVSDRMPRRTAVPSTPPSGQEQSNKPRSDDQRFGVPFFTLKGWDSIAQGNALGRSMLSLHPEDTRSFIIPDRLPQGVALGYAVPPLQGEEQDQSARFRTGSR